MHIRRIFVSLLLGVLATPVSMAATAHLEVHIQPVRDVSRDIPRGKRADPLDVAVLIGNRNYREDGIPDVEYAEADVDLMERYLIRTMGFRKGNIEVLKDATKADLETLFGTEGRPGSLQRKITPGRSRVFVYYVGHGAPDKTSGEGYFVPVDTDPDYIDNAGYSLSAFYASLQRLKAKQVIVVLDTCFSGRTQKGLLYRGVSPALLRVKRTASGLRHGAVLTSSAADQLSTWYPEMGHSLYTYFFLLGLRGDADASGDNVITTKEMSDYLAGKVPVWALRISNNKQDPQFEGEGDIVLARLRSQR